MKKFWKENPGLQTVVLGGYAVITIYWVYLVYKHRKVRLYNYDSIGYADEHDIDSKMIASPKKEDIDVQKLINLDKGIKGKLPLNFETIMYYGHRDDLKKKRDKINRGGYQDL